jgi:hypothetical protein
MKEKYEMQDKDFLARIQVGINEYIKENVNDYEDTIVLEEFLKWLYKTYGIEYHGNT